MKSLSCKGVNTSDPRIVELFDALQKIAEESGHNVLAPPMLRGKSGVSHSFSFLVASEKKICGVDIYENIGQPEVLKTRVKKLDTGASVFLISPIRAAEATEMLCAEYSIRILTPSDLQERSETMAKDCRPGDPF